MDLGADWSRAELWFDQAPAEIPAVLLGPREKGPGAEIVQTDSEAYFAYKRVATRPLVIALAVMLGLALTIAFVSVGLSDAAFAIPIAIVSVAVFIVVPAIFLVRFADTRHFADRPALLQLQAGDDSVTLPCYEFRIQWSDLHAVTELVGWYPETSGEQTRIRQFGLIWRAESRYRMVPLANISHGGRGLGSDLAELLQVPLLRAEQPWFDLQQPKRLKRT